MKICENDILNIPEEIKKLSASELKIAKEKAFNELISIKQEKRIISPNKKHIVFNFD